MGGTVTDIRIEGAQRIEPETIRSYLLIQPGEAWDDELVDRSLKALFATGLFADVNLSRVGSTLVVKVVEIRSSTASRSRETARSTRRI